MRSKDNKKNERGEKKRWTKHEDVNWYSKDMRSSATTTAPPPQLWTSRSGATLWNTYHYSYLPCSSLNHYSFLTSSSPSCFLIFWLSFIFFHFIFLFIYLFCLTFYKYMMEARSKMPLKENVSFLLTSPSSLPSFLRPSLPFFVHLSLSLFYFI